MVVNQYLAVFDQFLQSYLPEHIKLYSRNLEIEHSNRLVYVLTDFSELNKLFYNNTCVPIIMSRQQYNFYTTRKNAVKSKSSMISNF